MKRIPLRMCVGCGEMIEKPQLIRIVNNKEEGISLDPTGKRAGRGAYICKNTACLMAAKKAKRLERAFSMKVDDEIYEQLEIQLSKLED